MANKAALIIIAVIAATAMGVGAFVGLELGGGAAVASPTPTPTPDGGENGGATPTATATATASPTATPVPTVSPSEFNRTGIELAIQSRVNAEREERGHQRLRRFGVAVEMARFHSENMAEQGFVSHSADGLRTIDRYKRFEIHDRCRTEDDTGTGIREGDELETLAKVTAGRPVQVDGETRYYRNETAVANAVVDRWLAEDAASRKLFLGPADEVGIGVVVTDTGGVYATLDLC